MDEFDSSLEIPHKLYFRIGEVADLVSVDSHVLRYWEKEMDLKPHRSNSGQRLYRKIDILQFLKIKHLIHTEGYTIGGAKQALAQTNQTAVHTDQLNDLRTRLLDIQADLVSLKSRLNSTQ